jgi:hypothetical protein
VRHLPRIILLLRASEVEGPDTRCTGHCARSGE